jgi:hypothetical protein
MDDDTFLDLDVEEKDLGRGGGGESKKKGGELSNEEKEKERLEKEEEEEEKLEEERLEEEALRNILIYADSKNREKMIYDLRIASTPENLAAPNELQAVRNQNVTNIINTLAELGFEYDKNVTVADVIKFVKDKTKIKKKGQKKKY